MGVLGQGSSTSQQVLPLLLCPTKDRHRTTMNNHVQQQGKIFGLRHPFAVTWRQIYCSTLTDWSRTLMHLPRPGARFPLWMVGVIAPSLGQPRSPGEDGKWKAERAPPWVDGQGEFHAHGRLFPLFTLAQLGTDVEQQWIDLFNSRERVMVYAIRLP